MHRLLLLLVLPAVLSMHRNNLAWWFVLLALTDC
jgi:hypothetical protein